MISTGILKKLAKTRSSDINDLAAVSVRGAKAMAAVRL
jgi:hypothetical protein